MSHITKQLKVGISKGNARVWLAQLDRYGWTTGQCINIVYGADTITINKDDTGKRKVTSPSAGGVIDITGTSTTEFTQGAVAVNVSFTSSTITITRI